MDKICVVLVSLLFLSSCSVLEDRTACPCFVEVTFDKGVKDTTQAIVSLKAMVSNEVSLSDYSDNEPFIMEVKKGVYDFASWRGAEYLTFTGDHLAIKEGNDCDSLYSFNVQSLDCSGESAYVRVSFHKEFATLIIDTGKDAAEAELYKFRVSGNTAGINPYNLTPIEGNFYYDFNGGEQVLRVRLPRQMEGSYLYLAGEYDGYTLEPIDLAPVILSAGYDWHSASLEDIYLKVSIINYTISAAFVEPWEEAEPWVPNKQ